MEAIRELYKKDRTVDFFGTKWKIKFVDTIEVPDGNQVDGLTDSTNKILSIAVKNNSETELTFLHELIHSMLNTGQYLNSSRDEPMVEWLARCFNALIKQGILKWNL